MDIDIHLVHGDVSILDDIQDLWEELNQLHLEKSHDFKQHYGDFTFSSRKESLDMKESLHWIKSFEVKKTIVKVSVGNEEVFGFYSKYGFAPRLIELQLVPE